MIKVYHKAYDQLSEDAFEKSLSHLPELFHPEIKRFVRWQDRQAALYGKRLLQKALMDHGYEASLLANLQKSEHGRPFIEEIEEDFNLSHTDGHVVLAWSESSRVGIDIEEVKPIEIETFQRFLREEEYTAILASENQLRSFYKLWTIKESAIKADGRGLAIPLTDVLIKDNVATINNDQWYLYEINSVRKNVCCFVSADKNNEEVVVSVE